MKAIATHGEMYTFVIQLLGAFSFGHEGDSCKGVNTPHVMCFDQNRGGDAVAMLPLCMSACCVEPMHSVHHFKLTLCIEMCSL